MFDKHNEKRNSNFTDLSYYNQNIMDNISKKKNLIVVPPKTYQTKIHWLQKIIKKYILLIHKRIKPWKVVKFQTMKKKIFDSYMLKSYKTN